MEYLSLAKAIEHEIVIQKSRFIGLTYLISSEEELSLCLEDARERYPNATHYCYGAVIGLEGLVQRFSDDGEPSGTAGMPILQVLLQKGLKKCAGGCGALFWRHKAGSRRPGPGIQQNSCGSCQ